MLTARNLPVRVYTGVLIIVVIGSALLLSVLIIAAGVIYLRR